MDRVDKFMEEYDGLLQILFDAAKKEGFSMYSMVYIRKSDKVSEYDSIVKTMNTGLYDYDLFKIKQHIDDSLDYKD